MRLTVRLKPRAGRDEVEGVGVNGELLVRVRAPALDGTANEALLRLLAGELRLPRSALTIERGATARVKLIRLEGLAADVLTARWPGLRLGG
ncbi:hypothetical protein BH24CHL6_BH24CHL6_16510 [soil metagenome]